MLVHEEDLYRQVFLGIYQPHFQCRQASKFKCGDNLLESVFVTVSKSKLRISRPGPRPVWPGWRRAVLVTTEPGDGTIPLTIQSALIKLRSAITLLFTPHIYYLPAVATYIWVKSASSAAALGGVNYSVTTHPGWRRGGPGAKRSRVEFCTGFWM